MLFAYFIKQNIYVYTLNAYNYLIISHSLFFISLMQKNELSETNIIWYKFKFHIKIFF